MALRLRVPFALARSCRKFATEAAAGAQAGPAVPRKRSVARLVLTGLGAVTATTVAAVAALAYFDEGSRRSLKFWSKCGPIFVHYRWVQYSTRGKPEEVIDAEYHRLHTMYSPVVEALTWELRGFYLKLTQTCSTRDDFVPPEYMVWVKKTQAEVPVALSTEDAKRIVERELGKPVNEIFTSWDDSPIGTASIGQVYHAVLKDGREVAVKIQLPGMEPLFRSDIKTVINFCRLAMPQHVKPLLEIEAQFMTEFDYRLEAKNLSEVANNVMPVWGKKVCVPRPMQELCSKHVLVMDYLHGVRLVDGIRAQYSKVAQRMGRTLEDLEEEQKDKIRRGVLEYESAGENAFKTRLLAAAVRTVDVVKNTGRFVYNWTLGWVAGASAYQWSELPINLGEILTVLNHVHAYELFMDGAFNGDPHPGNILLMRDGRLGLIDYGQVKHLSTDARVKYAKLIIALTRGDNDEVVRVFHDEMGCRSKNNGYDTLWRAACFWNDRDTKDVCMGMNIQEFMDWLEDKDPAEQVPRDYVMPARVSVLLRGMGMAFGIRIRSAPLWAPYAERLLKEQHVEYPPSLEYGKTPVVDTATQHFARPSPAAKFKA